MMGTLEAIEIIEGLEEGNPIEAFQTLIDNGTVWNLQGFYGRTAMNLIEAGYCYMEGERRDDNGTGSINESRER